MVRLPVNTGPAGGFRAGMIEAFSDPSTRWAYLCEDESASSPSPAPVSPSWPAGSRNLPGRPAPTGAVVAYGRRFVGRGAHTVNLVPPPGAPGGFTPVDVACWGATLLSRSVVDAGVLPDPEWFFGLEDFDFFCRVREAGFEVLIDDDAARRVAVDQTTAGREEALRDRRPGDDDESWRAYYHARNSFALIRQHGRPSWYAWQLAYTARHLQAARGRAERAAIAHGLWDGATHRMGEKPRYVRRVGEFGPDAGGPAGGSVDPARGRSRRQGQIETGVVFGQGGDIAADSAVRYSRTSSSTPCAARPGRPGRSSAGG